ncbi:MAG TPA: hypothetical protein VFI31_29885 [Pirellulales bacterium]|nr:hypothetical protein [Pirellulales bacterium]
MNVNRFVASLLISALQWAVFLSAAAVAADQYGEEPAVEEESLATPEPEESADETLKTQEEQRASLPYTPYPAGLSWVLTPQAFRVPITNRIYYPPHTYVRRCPYYPRGYYWGANWRFNVIGKGNLLFWGSFRFNPYLTAAKAQHKNCRHPRYAPPPGPVGQAMLLGSTGPTAPAVLPPTAAGHSESGAEQEYEPQEAAVRVAPERRAVQPASTRRSMKPAKRSSAANSR